MSGAYSKEYELLEFFVRHPKFCYCLAEPGFYLFNKYATIP